MKNVICVIMDQPSTSKSSMKKNQLSNGILNKPKNTNIDLTPRTHHLEFIPHVKRKKCSSKKISGLPFPRCSSSDQIFTGIFTGISVEICDYNVMHAIYESGCFGKGSQSRSAPQIRKTNLESNNVQETLSLDLEESFFLANYIKVLRINYLNGTQMQWQEQLEAFEKIKSNFIDCFAAYLYLKSKNWVVKSGIKFGGDFLIYKSSLSQYHASFIVFVSNIVDVNTNLRPKDIKGIQRIAETSDKDVLLLEISKPADFKVETLDSMELCRITETIIRRFNYKAFVQNHNK